MSSELPHLQSREEAPLRELIASIKSGTTSETCYLAVSNGFWEPEEQEVFPAVYEAYAEFYSDTLAEVSRLAGAPDFSGGWDSPKCPEWAHGVQIAVWSDRFWLRIEHEDRECPVIVALSPVV